MKNLFKYFVAIAYKPLLVKYLSKTRDYTYKGIVLSVPREVFHPGFFFSTKILLGFISRMKLSQRSFLELGAGSGLISIYATKCGASVTATDINSTAVEFLGKNSDRNKVQFRIIHSDLFDKIPPEDFEIIAINPPYYKRRPRSDADYAWCCGENGEYFDRLFNGLAAYMGTDSTVLLVLCDGCDMKMIIDMAMDHGFQLHCVFKKQNLLENNFIFKIEKQDELRLA